MKNLGKSLFIFLLSITNLMAGNFSGDWKGKSIFHREESAIKSDGTCAQTRIKIIQTKTELKIISADYSEGYHAPYESCVTNDGTVLGSLNYLVQFRTFKIDSNNNLINPYGDLVGSITEDSIIINNHHNIAVNLKKNRVEIHSNKNGEIVFSQDFNYYSFSSKSEHFWYVTADLKKN